jgi:hypothetical protein
VLFLRSRCLWIWSFHTCMEPLLDIYFLFDSVLLDLYPA